MNKSAEEHVESIWVATVMLMVNTVTITLALFMILARGQVAMGLAMIVIGLVAGAAQFAKMNESLRRLVVKANTLPR